MLALILWVRGHVKFDWETFLNQIQHVDWRRIALGVAFIWLGYVLRGLRWAVLLRPQKKVNGFSLIGSQVIGFTAVALFGRLAEVVRIYLITKRTRLTFSSQAAVYTVERMFDLGSMALIFSSALLLAPDRATLPHHEALAACGALRAGARRGARCLRFCRTGIRRRCRPAGTEKPVGDGSGARGVHQQQDSCLSRRSGRDSQPSHVPVRPADFAGHVGFNYGGVPRNNPRLCAFPATGIDDPGALHGIDGGKHGGLAIQLPIIGWFTQIAVIAGVTQKIFNVSPEAALGCGAMLLIVTFLSVIPLGLIWARFEHVSLKQISEESEHVAAEEAGAPRSGYRVLAEQEQRGYVFAMRGCGMRRPC